MNKEIRKYDKNNNEIYYKDSDGYECWKEYDENNNLIHFKDSNNTEYWEEYDENNNHIRYKSNGYECWKEYDENNNLIHFKDSNGDEYWKEYDYNNNLIHYKNSNGGESWYNENDKLIHFKDSNGYEEWKEYDSNNNLIHYKNSNGYEYWKEYDSNGNEFHYKDSDGDEEWYVYINNEKIKFRSYNDYKNFISKLCTKELIKEMLNTDPVIKQTYENENGCFKNIIVPAIMDSASDNTLETILAILANQSIIYDKLINNIAQYGNAELINKCKEDLNNIFNNRKEIYDTMSEN